jgi:hypothetical protein
MQKKSNTQLASEAEQYFLEHSAGLSGADIEAVLVRTRMQCAMGSETCVSTDDVKTVLADFVPPSYPTEIELQSLVAVLECTSRQLLPERYRTTDRAELVRRVNELQLLARS